jgi:hypothetical protein
MNIRNDASEKEKKLAEELTKIGEAARKEVQDDIALGKQRIEDATTAAKQRAAEENNRIKNELELNQSRLDSLRKINEAERILQDLRGE